MEVSESQSEGEERDELELDEYFLEQILEKRTSDGEIEYLLEWKNDSDEINGWELKEDIKNIPVCAELIADFENQLLKNDTKEKQQSSEIECAFSNSENTSTTLEAGNSKERKNSASSEFKPVVVPVNDVAENFD